MWRFCILSLSFSLSPYRCGLGDLRVFVLLFRQHLVVITLWAVYVYNSRLLFFTHSSLCRCCTSSLYLILHREWCPCVLTESAERMSETLRRGQAVGDKCILQDVTCLTWLRGLSLLFVIIACSQLSAYHGFVIPEISFLRRIQSWIWILTRLGP
jgi:hypothetical protein